MNASVLGAAGVCYTDHVMSGVGFLSGVYYGRYEKVVHLILSGAMTALFFIFFGLAWAMVLSLIAGITKELWDASKPNDHFDIFDMLSNSVGIALAAVLIISMRA